MSVPELAKIFEALTRVCADVTEVKVAYGVNLGTTQSSVIRPIGDEVGDTPATWLVPGPWSVIPGGGHARFTFTAIGSIWVPRKDPGDSLVTLLKIFSKLFDAFGGRAKAYEPDPILQSVLITEGAGLSDAEWPEESNSWYLTWPFELEVKANVPQLYLPQ